MLGEGKMPDGSQAWALPLPIIEGIYYHHDPQKAPVDKTTSTRTVASMIYVGECLFECYHLNTESAHRKVQRQFDSCLNFLGLDFKDIMKIREETEERLEIL